MFFKSSNTSCSQEFSVLSIDDNRRRSQVKLGSAADFLLDINETDLSLLTASIKAPSGRDEPCLLKRLPNNHIGNVAVCAFHMGFPHPPHPCTYSPIPCKIIAFSSYC